jgi:hypothetical protein
VPGEVVDAGLAMVGDVPQHGLAPLLDGRL